MVWIWFLVALVLLVAALVLLRLDARQRGGGAGGGTRPQREAAADMPSVGEPPGDDEGPRLDVPADGAEQDPGAAERTGAPRLAPFQRSEEPDIAGEVAGGGSGPQLGDVPAPDAGFGSEERCDLEPAPLDPTEPAVESSPRLLDRVRALLPARRQWRSAPDSAEEPAVDPLANSPVVRWLEDREFAPTPTPAPEFIHGDFAGGLPALGTVSHGAFRGRRAIMGVTGGRTVLALRRDTASDVVLDLSRPDVDAEPGFHDAGELGELEARTSDYGRLDLIDRDRLVEVVGCVPTGVRRIWAEGEWVAATIDGVDDPSTWDDVVVALHGAADALAALPPVTGRARALPVEIDPGAPGASAGPEADPTVGMDGEVGIGMYGAPDRAALPDPEDFAVVDDRSGGPQLGEVATEITAVGGAGPVGPGHGEVSGADTDETDAPASPEPRRAGHLRLVPDRTSVLDLADAPVVADRGDTTEAATGIAATDATDGPEADGPEATDGPDVAAEPVVEEPDPFAQILEPSGPVPSRGDVAADHLAPRPPLSRPTRGVGQAYPEDASVPPLAAGAVTGSAGIKPLGSEDDEDEIRDEVKRFDAARIDGGSDLAPTSGGRHGPGLADAASGEDTGRLSVAELAAKMGAAPSGGRHRHRRADTDGDPAADGEQGVDGVSSGEAVRESDDPQSAGRERPGVDPDAEQTARLQLPPDIRD
ncbi:hypothetical protein [Dietzia lutea]|uniref:Uncharacterized protein n=1 Tax=Dietzia lutea TaxID=546160 RepID=A0A2S1RA62_9ACTN|nr:hypothetical protein [Dietzia lutea]AWH93154.1 hypothetical protein A6035_14305 [Dietzia lutea]